MADPVKRKPVPSRNAPITPSIKAEVPISQPDQAHYADPAEEAYSQTQDNNTNGSALQTDLGADLDEQLEHLQLETDQHSATPPLPREAVYLDPGTTLDADESSHKPSRLKNVLGEVKHFAGGLISHPYEATKHYSVLRHSHGIVFYQGPNTSIAITVFSDQPLPADRRLFLQKRGFSGRTGLKVGAVLGTRSAWIDVTPSIGATAETLPKADERAWQRDIGRFLRKAKDAKHLRNHRPYETDVVRIPHMVEDGYIRIVLCVGRGVLCPSPVFRYASSSTDPSILRGASLSTLPLELGIRVGSLIASNAANTAAHGAMQPAVNTVQSLTQPYQMGGLTQWAATTTYDASGAADKIDGAVESINQNYDEKRDRAFQPASGDVVDDAVVIGPDDGPVNPYPIRFSGRVVAGIGKHSHSLGVATANLSTISADILLRLSGVYIAWASISRTTTSKKSPSTELILEKWLPAIVAVAPAEGLEARVVQQKAVSVHLVHDFGDAISTDTRLALIVMAYLHPHVTGLNTEVQQTQMQQDIATASASLDRPSWKPEATLQRIKSDSADRSFTDRMADARESGQKQVDRLPIHRLGIRTNSMGSKDQLIGNGGICVRR